MARGAELTIKAEYALLIQPFISKEETRYYLTGFYVQKHPKEGALIVATDGHMMAIFHDESGSVTIPGIIRLDKTTLAACKDGRDEKTPRVLRVEGDTATVYRQWDAEKTEGHIAGANDDAVIDGTFPDWRKVVPAFPTMAGSATYNADLLKRFDKIKPPHTKVTQVRVFSPNERDPAVVLTNRRDFVGVIMPMRGDTGETLPSWLPLLAPVEAAAAAS